MSVGSRMKERRESLGMTQIQLAEALGLTKGAIGNYETEANSPKASILYKIFEVLKCDANYLFQDEMKELETDGFTVSEIKMIKKYRILDEYGKEVVDSVLDIEHKRYTEQAKEKAQSEDAVKIMYIQYNDQKASAGEGFTLDYEYMQRWGVQYNELTKKADFCVDVQGDSMEPRFYDGDTLLIRRQPAVDVGEIGLFILDEKGYVKKWGGDRLISLNPAYEDIEIEENSRLDCAGKVLGVLDPDWIIET